jgi:hypothetical protein
MHRVIGRFIQGILSARIFGRMPKLATCIGGFSVLLAILLLVAALFLPKYAGTAAPPDDSWKNVELTTKSPIRAWLEVKPEHIHLGDAFSLTVHVVWLTDEVEFSRERLVNSVLLGSFVERNSEDSLEKWEGRSHYYRTYLLQALFTSATGVSISQQVAFTDFAYKTRNSPIYTNKSISTFINIVPRFGQGAQPSLAPLKGAVYPFSYYARFGVTLLATLFLICAFFVTIGALWPKSLRKSAVSLKGKYAGLKNHLIDSRKALFALEEIAESILLKHDEHPARIWAGEFPVWHTDLWRNLWSVIHKAYKKPNPTEQDAKEAYEIVGLLIKYKGREKDK